MNGIFRVKVDDVIYDVRPLNLPPDGIQYGISKNGVIQFIIQRKISYNGDTWSIAYPDLNVNAPAELVDSIVKKVHAHFT